jgi:hypothetical protein
MKKKLLLISILILFLNTNSAGADLLKEITESYHLNTKTNPQDQCKLMDILYSIVHESKSEVIKNIKQKTDIKNINVFHNSSNLDIINNEIFIRYFNIYFNNLEVDQIALVFNKDKTPIGYFSALIDSFGYSQDDYSHKIFYVQRESKDDLDISSIQNNKTNLIISGCNVLFFNKLNIN